MNHDAPQPSFELPAPLPDSGEFSDLSIEQAPARPEQAPLPPVAAPLPVSGTAQQPMLQQIAPVQSPQSPSSSVIPVGPAVADDHDLIEKEWVVKAKQIVAATREDPHAQSRELSRFKADYLKKRYNKDIKVEES
jgi:hypothetical protein